MRSIVLYIIVFMCMITPSVLFAQIMPMSEKHNFNLQVFYAIDKLNEFSEIYDDDSAEEFVQLFKDGTLIYNDLLGLSFVEKLTIEEYAKILKNEGKEIDVTYKNINKDSLYQTASGEWQMVVSFDKEISYFNKCGVYFSSRSYYKSDHKIKATFAWDPKKQKVKIVALDGSMNGVRAPLTEDYFVIQSDITNISKKANKKSKSQQNTTIFDERLAHVLVNNKDSILLDSTYNQAIIATSIETAKFKYNNDFDVSVKAVPVKEECNFYKLKFTPSRWRLKTYAEIAVEGFYKLDFQSDLFVSCSAGQEFGLELGYICPSSKKTKFGIFFGAGYSINKMRLGFRRMEYSYKSEDGLADIDGDSYTRFYQINNMVQTIRFKDVFVPLYFNFDRRFGKAFSMYLDLGAKAYFNLEADASDIKGTYATYGKYEKYDNLILDYNSGINGFTQKENLNSSNLLQPTLEVEPFSLDAFGRLGCRVAMTKRLLFDCSLGYQMNVIESIKLNEAEVLTSMNGSKNSNAIAQYSASSNTEQVRNMLDYAKSANRQAIKLNIGLMLKF